MADDFAPPPGPPPPKVPEGWKAVYNTQYNEWFYVNIYTKVSQWDKPTSPVYPSSDHSAPSGLPPGYTPSNTSSTPSHPTSTKPPFPNTAEDDATLAARLQAEENARAGPASHRNAQEEYINTPLPPNASTYPSDLPPRPQERSQGASGGFLGKILGKAGSHQSHGAVQQGYGAGAGGYPPSQGYPAQGYPYGNYPPQQQGYGGGYGGGGGGYGSGGPGFMQQQKPKRGGGMGMGGAAALGLGGGLLGGALLAEGMEHHDQEEREEGYEDAMDDRDDGGYGGGDDFGGGDF